MRPSITVVHALVWVLSASCFGQSPKTNPANSRHRKAPAAEHALASPVHLPAPDTIPDGFPIRLRLTKTLDPTKLKSGEEVPFVLTSDLYFRSLLLARKGESVKAVVESANGPRLFSRGSRLTLQVQSTTLLDGQRLALRGRPDAHGGIDASVVPVQAVEGVFGAAIFPPAAIVSLLLVAAPGTNHPLPENTLTTAFVDGDVRLDTVSLADKQPPPATTEAGRVRIVRGVRGNHLHTDLFCNGTPMARLAAKHYLDLDLPAGWYRFSIKSDHPNALIYVVPGMSYLLLSDLSSIHEAEPDETSLNTIGLGRAKDRNLAGLINDSKPVDSSDVYDPGVCAPLAEQIR